VTDSAASPVPAGSGSTGSTLAIGWERLHHDTRILADRLLGRPERYRGIVAVARGGLVPAAILARELDLRLVETICMCSYQEDHRRGALQVLKGPPPGGGAEAGAGMLVVDDLSDTGATARAVRERLPGATLVTLYVKPQGRTMVDLFVDAVPQDCWILFPWDCAPREVPPLVRRQS